LEVAIGLGAIPFTPSADGWAPLYQDAIAGNWGAVGTQLKQGFLGMEANGSLNIGAALNPFDMNHARYTKTLIYAYLISKVRRMLGLKLDRVPFIGRWIS
jgi:hypothetical protein